MITDIDFERASGHWEDRKRSITYQDFNGDGEVDLYEKTSNWGSSDSMIVSQNTSDGREIQQNFDVLLDLLHKNLFFRMPENNTEVNPKPFSICPESNSI